MEVAKTVHPDRAAAKVEIDFDFWRGRASLPAAPGLGYGLCGHGGPQLREVLILDDLFVARGDPLEGNDFPGSLIAD